MHKISQKSRRDELLDKIVETQAKEIKCCINILGFYLCLLIPMFNLETFGDSGPLVFMGIVLASLPVGAFGIWRCLKLSREREGLTHQLIMENLNSRVKK